MYLTEYDIVVCNYVTGAEPESEKGEGGEKTAAEPGHETWYYHRKRCADQETAGRDHVAGHGLISARKFLHHRRGAHQHRKRKSGSKICKSNCIIQYTRVHFPSPYGQCSRSPPKSVIVLLLLRGRSVE